MKIGSFASLQIALALLLSGILYFVLRTTEPDQIPFVHTAIGLTATSSLLAYIVVFRGLESNPRGFFNYVIMGMMLKMGMGLVSIMAVAYWFKAMAAPYAIGFLISYFIFTGTEVYFLMKKANASK